MADTVLILLGVSFVLFFGFFAELLFARTRIPDILFLILLGFALGPYGLALVRPDSVAILAPVFTGFALLFLIYDGAFNIDLASFARGLGTSLLVTAYNFSVSTLVVGAIAYAFLRDPLLSLLAGVVLGGTSSAFVMPLLKQLKVKGETYSILALESAFTDVLCIVFSLTVIELIRLQSFSASVVVGKIAALFAVAAAVGIVAGILWILLVVRVFKEQRSYMMTVAYLVLVYVVAELLNGNGAIAALFFGLMLKNSRQLTAIVGGVMNGDKEAVEGVSVTSANEEFFYAQISFFLKTFFFVYIGILIDLGDRTALFVGALIALGLMVARMLMRYVARGAALDRQLTEAIFARGLAAAAIAQLVVMSGIGGAAEVAAIVYAAIPFTIVLSSVRVFLAKRPEPKPAAAKA